MKTIDTKSLLIGILATVLVMVTGCAVVKPSSDLKAEEKKVIGEYELKEGERTFKLVLLENGKGEIYRKEEKGTWKISGKEVHVGIEGVTVLVYKIEPNGDLTWIANIRGGKREDVPIKEHFTFKKLK